MNRSKGLMFFLVFLLSMIMTIPSGLCTTVTGATVDVYPKQGDITTDIFVHVRGEPLLITCEGFLYFYWDDKCIVQRMPCISHNHAWNVWELSWDVTVKVPNEYSYSELGLHNLTATVEAVDGVSVSATTVFEIINYIPPPEWWEDLPEDFIDEITGPQGITGDKGDTGSQGIQGEQGQIGPQGLQGEKGDKSDKGDTGPYPNEAVMFNLGISAISLIISIIAVSLVYKMKK